MWGTSPLRGREGKGARNSAASDDQAAAKPAAGLWLPRVPVNVPAAVTQEDVRHWRLTRDFDLVGKGHNAGLDAWLVIGEQAAAHIAQIVAGLALGGNDCFVLQGREAAGGG